MTTPLLAALLLVGGGAQLMLRSQVRRVDLRARLNTVDGVPSPSRRVLLRAGFAVVLMLAVPVLPVVPAVAGAPVLAVVIATAAVLPMTAMIGTELFAAVRRSGMPRRVPLVAQWQRRFVGALIARASAPYPAPRLRRPRPRRRGARPALTAAGKGRRLLVVPPGAPPRRLWDVAETYLGARSRYRDVLALNRGRRSPGGAIITEDSTVLAGWTLLMPRDATGTGLVDLVGDPRLPLQPGPADRGRDAGSSGPARKEPDPVTPAAPDQDAVEVSEPAATARARRPDGPSPTTDPVAAGSVEPGGPGVVPGAEAVPLEYPAADLPWDLVHARFLAEGFRALLQTRRRDREHRRAVGAGVRPLDPAAAAVATAVEIGADRRGVECVDRLVRGLPVPPPPIAAVRLLRDTVELTLAAPDPAPPAPFTSDPTGRTWSLGHDVEIPAAGDAALPGLASLGRDRSGWTLLDLTGRVTVITGEVRAARMVATAIGLELLVNRWSAGARVVMVGFGRTFDGTAPALTVADRIDAVLDAVVLRVCDDVVPQFLVLAAPPAAAVDELLRQLADPGFGAPLGVLVVGGATGDGRRELELGPTGVLTCAELGLVVGAHALSTTTAAALARLVAAETNSEAGGAVDPPELPRAVDADAAAVIVRLFGEPVLVGPAGTLDADPVTCEIVAFLALHGVATPREVARAVFPFGIPEAELHMALKVVVELLAGAAAGEPGLLEYPDGRLELTADVQADLHLFVGLAAAGREDDALALLGRAAEAHRSRVPHGARYAWLAGVPLVRALPGHVADVAHAQVRRRLAEHRPDLAAVAATAGLVAQPTSQVLRADLQRALLALGGGSS